MARRSRPAKPHRDYPLFAHANGQWAKKVRGKLYYFGRWDEPDAALEKWLSQKDYLIAGVPPPETDGLTVRSLCDRFLTAKLKEVDIGRITVCHYDDLHHDCLTMIDVFGEHRPAETLRPEDFSKLYAAISVKQDGSPRSPGSVGNTIARMRSVFRWAFENGVIEAPMRFGDGFRRPSASVKRRHKAKVVQEGGRWVLEPEEARRLIEAASGPLRSMVLLGLNGGFAAADLASLPLAVARDATHTGWMRYARVKTGVDRNIPLWPETRDSLVESMEQRPEAAREEVSRLAFLTRHGNPWGGDGRDHPITQQFRKLMKRASVERTGIAFNILRHTFQTVGDEAGYPLATRAVMGHVDPTISGTYRERVSDVQIRAAVDHVRQWVFPIKIGSNNK